MRLRKKRGEILVPETFKLIIAVLCIVVLLVLAVKMYTMFRTQTKLEQAKATLDEIVKTINFLDKSSDKTENVLILNPKDWWLVDFNSATAPAVCSNKDCLCICPKTDKESCEKNGVCKVPLLVSKVLHVTPSNKVENFLSLSVVPFALLISLKNSMAELSYGWAQKDKEFFDKFLESCYSFLNLGEKTIQEQILLYSDSGKWGRDLTFKEVWKGDNEMKNSLSANIKKYFEKYNYPIYVIITEEGRDSSLSPVLSVEAGGNKQISNLEVLPYSEIKYILTRIDEKKPLIVKFISR